MIIDYHCGSLWHFALSLSVSWPRGILLVAPLRKAVAGSAG